MPLKRWLRKWRIKLRQRDINRLRKRMEAIQRADLWAGVPWSDEELEQFIFGNVLKPL